MLGIYKEICSSGKRGGGEVRKYALGGFEPKRLLSEILNEKTS